jgi:hypothetical protein
LRCAWQGKGNAIAAARQTTATHPAMNFARFIFPA